MNQMAPRLKHDRELCISPFNPYKPNITREKKKEIEFSPGTATGTVGQGRAKK